MGQWALSAFACLWALVLVTETARAEVIQGASLLQDDSGATVELTTPDTLHRPRIRTSAGIIRLWFPNIENNLRVECVGDGGVICWMKIHWA